MGGICVIAYASQSLCPSERSMCNYSSAKLELLVLKWAVTEKCRDYLLGLQFQVYMDNNPLAYVQESKLGASQIRWLSELALFKFTIKYQTGHFNRATDAVSRRPFNPSCDFNTESTDSNEVEVISYSATCTGVETIPYSLVSEALHQCLNGSKIPQVLKQEAQDISCVVKDVTNYVKTCPQCQTAKGDYTDPKTKLGTNIANNPMDLLCIGFTKVDPSKSSKENILVLTDAFTKF